MEWTTILGLILGFASMSGVLVLGKTGATLNTFIDPPALLMVFGGAAAVTLIGFPSRQLQNLFSILKKPFLSRLEEPAELINELVSWRNWPGKTDCWPWRRRPGKSAIRSSPWGSNWRSTARGRRSSPRS